jgi:hypothetical protein
MKTRMLIPTLLITLAVLATGCLGPKPVMDSYQAQPPQAGSDQPFRVEAIVRNAGPGDGEVEVEVELSNKQNGEIIRSDKQEVDIKSGETQHVLFEMNLPPSAQSLDPEQIEVQVDAHYPIQ